MKGFSKLLSATVVLTTMFAPLGSASVASNEGAGVVAVGAPHDLSKADSWAQDAILKAKNLQLMNGDPDGNFRPHDTLTREEVAVILANLLHLSASADTKVSFSDVAANDWGYKQIAAVQSRTYARL